MQAIEFLHTLAAPYGALLQKSFPNVRDANVDDTLTVVVKWYLSPTQHVIEMVMFHLLLLPLCYWLSQRPWQLEVPAIPKKVSSAVVWSGSSTDATDLVYSAARRKGGAPLKWLDGLLCVIAWVTGPATVWYKMQDGREAYLLQPCHIQNFIIMYLTLDSNSAFASGLFHFYLCTAYGTILALATPDLRGLALPFEVQSFFTQHVMLLMLPMVWVARRRYPLYAGAVTGGLRGFYSILLTWAAFFLLHLDVFWPASLFSLRNINYMMVPPPGPLRLFGWGYRPVMGLFCILAGLLSRDVLVAAVVWLSGLPADVARETKAAKDGLGSGWSSPISTPTPTADSDTDSAGTPKAKSGPVSPSLSVKSGRKSPRAGFSVGGGVDVLEPVGSPQAANAESEVEPEGGSGGDSTPTVSRGRGLLPPSARIMGDTVASAAKKKSPSPSPSARRRTTGKGMFSPVS